MKAATLRKNKRIVLEFPIDIATEIKMRSAKRNISMKLWIYRAVMKAIKEEDKYK